MNLKNLEYFFSFDGIAMIVIMSLNFGLKVGIGLIICAVLSDIGNTFIGRLKRRMGFEEEVSE